MLEKLPGSSQLEWIERSVAPLLPLGPGPACVKHFVPPIFEAYAKIRHTVYLDETITDPRRTYDDGVGFPFPLDDLKDEPEVAEVLREAVSEPGVRGYLQYESVPVPDGAPRLTWPEIAERLGAAVYAEDDLGHLFRRAGFESWPRQMIPSSEGRMDSESATGLVECIARICARETVYLWLPWGSDNTAYQDQVLYSCVIEDLHSFAVDEKWNLTPEYCWPESRSWCISTDRDSLYSLLGGSTALVSAVLTHPLLDAVSVEPSTSLTGFESRPTQPA